MAIIRLFHGADSGKILHIINTGTMTPDSQGEIYFDEASHENCFMHGADTTKKACFVLKVQVELAGLHYYRTQKPGNPNTLIVRTASPLPVKVIVMYVRTGTRDEGFDVECIAGEEKMKLRLQ